MESTAEVRLVSSHAHTPRRRRIDEDRRGELLAQVQAIVLAEGFANLTVDELAARLQCSKSTLYAIASSKERLVTTAIRSFLQSMMVRVEERIEDIQDPTQRIATYLNAVGSEMQHMSQDCFEDLGANDATREVYVAHSERLRARLVEFIEKGVTAGEFRAVHAKFVSEAVSLLIDGIQWGRLLVAGQFGDLDGTVEMSLDEAYTTLSDFVLAALTNRH